MVAQLQNSDTSASGVLYDATFDAAASTALVELMVNRRRLKGSHGELAGWSTPDLADIAESITDLRPALVRAEQRTNSMAFGDKLILKLFRRIESGINPDFEIGQFLNRRRAAFPHTLPLVGD